MMTFLLQRGAGPARRFYRVELGYNLFGEYSVLRDWGRGQRIACFANLREAFAALERWTRRARRRGYETTA